MRVMHPAGPVQEDTTITTGLGLDQGLLIKHATAVTRIIG
jgi:hypothetical protein